MCAGRDPAPVIAYLQAAAADGAGRSDDDDDDGDRSSFMLASRALNLLPSGRHRARAHLLIAMSGRGDAARDAIREARLADDMAVAFQAEVAIARRSGSVAHLAMALEAHVRGQALALLSADAPGHAGAVQALLRRRARLLKRGRAFTRDADDVERHLGACSQAWRRVALRDVAPDTIGAALPADVIVVLVCPSDGGALAGVVARDTTRIAHGGTVDEAVGAGALVQMTAGA